MQRPSASHYVAVSLLPGNAGRTVAVAPIDGPDQPVVSGRLLRQLRIHARAEIERLIDFLDASEPDPDIEDDDPLEDDPSGIADYEGLLEQCPSIYRHSERAE